MSIKREYSIRILLHFSKLRVFFTLQKERGYGVREREQINGADRQDSEVWICDYLGDVFRGAVEETLNAMLDAEAEEFCGAERHQRCADQGDTWFVSYKRKLYTSTREVKLRFP